MAKSIRIAVYTNADDAFVAWAPSEFIAGCRGFRLERARKTPGGSKVELVENRVGFNKDHPKSGDHKPSNLWPFQRFNWTDHAVDIGNKVRFRITAMIDVGAGKPFEPGPASPWSRWCTLSSDAGDGFAFYFNRGLVLSQFVARYMRAKHLSAAEFKASLKDGVDPKFRAFLEGDLGLAMRQMLKSAKGSETTLHAALYELDDASLEDAMIATGPHLNLILANGSDKNGDGNAASRKRLNDAGIPTIDRLLKSKGLGHNKFVAVSQGGVPTSVWTGSTNWSLTGLCTQINNALSIEHAGIAKLYRSQWNQLKDASPPALDPANFPPALVAANDTPHTFSIGNARATIWFTRTSNGADMDALREIIASARKAILFLMFMPGKDGLHTLAAARANERAMYARGVVSTLGTAPGDSAKNVLDINLVNSEREFKPDHYTVVQPQGIDKGFGPWIAEVNRSTFLSQIGHAIVHSKVLVIDPLSKTPVVVTGSHNFSASASEKNDENFVIVRGHAALAQAYATHVMSVYQHYRYRSYVRETLAQGKTPWSYLDDDDKWLKAELKSKALEIDFWA